ncbi:hypothetical protein GY45DRAFT_613134 [Cubamyces sp. BRFM 1775]|nr:hypothetical protein GY45DRAFT_613134 [Cubamyces sp. BRFM 1775]
MPNPCLPLHRPSHRVQPGLLPPSCRTRHKCSHRICACLSLSDTVSAFAPHATELEKTPVWQHAPTLPTLCIRAAATTGPSRRGVRAHFGSDASVTMPVTAYLGGDWL